jgi:hypothetical protein
MLSWSGPLMFRSAAAKTQMRGRDTVLGTRRRHDADRRRVRARSCPALKKRKFRAYVGAYLIVNALLILIWANYWVRLLLARLGPEVVSVFVEVEVAVPHLRPAVR